MERNFFVDTTHHRVDGRQTDMSRRHELIMPDLGMPTLRPTASVWLVEEGREVTVGDRVLEVLCGSVTVDLPAPASGVLVATLVGEDEPLAVGQVLAIIESDED